MSKFEVGDKVVLEMLSIDGDGYYKVGSEHYLLVGSPKNLDEVVEPLSTYTAPLESKIRRQAAQITRLLVENEKLKAENGNVIFEIEQAFDRGCNAAWKLAQKIAKFQLDGGYSIDELKAIFGHPYLNEIFDLTFSEAAAKVAEWKKAKEEICVGDVVECEEHYGVVVGVGEVYVKVFTSDWTSFQWMKKDCTKTGRHIDVDAWLAQIGGESDETEN